jgi:O-antigen ligase
MSFATDYSDDDWQETAYESDLAKGLWPRSALMWLIFGWLALYIIRPWEVLMPWLQTLRIERTYCLLVMSFIVFSGKLRIDFSRQSIALGLLLLAMMAASITGISFEQSRGTVYAFLVHVAMYIAMVSVVRKPRDLLCISAMYLAIMAMYLGKAQWEYFLYGRHAHTQGVPRLLGIDNTYRHYNSVAASALMTLPFLQLLWSMRPEIGEAVTAKSSKRLKWMLIAYGFLAVTSVLLTNSRGGMLGLVIFFFLACITGKTAFRAIGTLAVSVIVAAPLAYLALPDTQRERFETLWSGEEETSAQESLELRKVAALDGLRMFVENPVTGVGPGNFKSYRASRGDESRLEAHNVFVQLLGETGILGGIAFAAFVACAWLNFRYIRKAAIGSNSPEASFLNKLALAGRNSLLLLIYFGFLGSNLDRFNWYWLAGLGVAGVAMTRQLAAWTPEDEERHDHDQLTYA